MKRAFFLALLLMAMTGLGGIVFERAVAQNTNSSTTMSSNTGSSRRASRRWHRRHRRQRHRRGRRGTNKNANQ
jgi:hypothetical protein